MGKYRCTCCWSGWDLTDVELRIDKNLPIDEEWAEIIILYRLQKISKISKMWNQKHIFSSWLDFLSFTLQCTSSVADAAYCQLLTSTKYTEILVVDTQKRKWMLEVTFKSFFNSNWSARWTKAKHVAFCHPISNISGHLHVTNTECMQNWR